MPRTSRSPFRALTAAMLLAGAVGQASAQGVSDGEVRIGVLTDLSGVYSDASGRGELTHAVSGGNVGAAEGNLRVPGQRLRRQEARRDQQRLGNGGVPDGLSVGLRPVERQVDTSGLREAVQGVDGGAGEPGGEESGGLGALSGRDDRKHEDYPPGPSGLSMTRDAQSFWMGFVGIL